MKNILLVFTFFCFAGYAKAEKLTNVTIEPNNKANFRFDKNPEEYNTTLSDDKKIITVTVPGYTVVDRARQTTALRIIKDVIVSEINDNLEINIYLDNEYGYTAVLMPFSRNLAVEAFSWNELSKSEDHYRTGLLAIEDKIYLTTINELREAVKLKHPQASAILGILSHKAGYNALAEKLLNVSLELNSDIPDIYAALSRIYLLRGDTKKNIEYLEKFTELTGIESFSHLPLDSTLTKNINPDEFEFVDSILKEIYDNTLQKAEKDSALTENFKGLFPENQDTLSGANTKSFFPWWSEYLLMVVAVVILLVIFRYVKWRNKKINEQQKTGLNNNNNKFDNELRKSKQNITSNSSIAAKTYKQNQLNELNEKIKSKAEAEEKHQKELQEVIKKKLEQSAKEKPVRTVSQRKKIHPKIELAMHLAKEQQNIKNRNFEQLKDKELPADADKLNEVAKKLGIEKGSLEVKNAIDKITKDPAQVAKLAEKFSQFRKE